MDDSTFITLFQARKLIANGNTEELYNLLSSVSSDILYGTILDKQLKSNNTESLKSIIHSLKNKNGINNVNDNDIKFSKKKVIKDIDKNNINENDINNIFISIENNIDLYNKKFDNKIFRINSSNNKKTLISINRCSLTHLLGISIFEWQNIYKDIILEYMPKFKEVLSNDYIDMCINEDELLVDALYILLENKETITNEILSKNNDLNKAINMNKLKVKNYLFDKSDFTYSPSRIIRYNNKNSKIEGNYFLIRDFVNNEEDELLYFSFRNLQYHNYKVSESLLYNYLTISALDKLSFYYTTSIDVYEKSNFDLNNPSSVIEFEKHEIDFLKSKTYTIQNKNKHTK